MVRFNTLACYTHIHADGTEKLGRSSGFESRWIMRRSDGDENNEYSSRRGWFESEAI